MTTTKTDPKVPTAQRTLIKKELLEPFLKFPSGLTVTQAKKNAKALKKAQGISQTEAMKIICYGNGIIDVRDYSQAFDSLVMTTFDRSHRDIGFVQHIESTQIIGCWWSDNDNPEDYQSIQGSTCDPKYYNHDREIKRNIERVVEFINSEKENKHKRKRFLAAVKDCISFLGGGFYSVYKASSLDEVTELNQIDIDVEALLNSSGGGGHAIMSYALASAYNTRATGNRVMRAALRAKANRDGHVEFDISSEDDIKALSEYTNDYRSFGAMCYNLDDDNKRIIKAMLDNYHGW